MKNCWLFDWMSHFPPTLKKWCNNWERSLYNRKRFFSSTKSKMLLCLDLKEASLDKNRLLDDCRRFPPLSSLWLSADLMVMEAWHGERPSESFYAVAQVGDTSHGLRVFKQEVLELLEFSWITEEKRAQILISPISFVSTPAGSDVSSCRSLHAHLSSS